MDNEIITKVIDAYKKQSLEMLNLIEQSAEEIENCYGHETKLSVELRSYLKKFE